LPAGRIFCFVTTWNWQKKINVIGRSNIFTKFLLDFSERLKRSRTDIGVLIGFLYLQIRLGVVYEGGQ
jgi:hypothetical protein